MIDTLNIDFGNNIRVDNPDLVVTSSRTSYSEGAPVHESHLWTDPKKGIVTGESAYFRHTENFPLDISYRRWRDGKMHFVVCTSVPKLLDGVNLRSIDSLDFDKYISILKERLSCLGIEVDPPAGRIARIDLFKQDRMIADFGEYAELFNQFNIPRTDLKKAETSFLWKNRLSNDWAINVYDKGVQMKSQDPEHNILRIEVQFRLVKAVEQVLGFSSIADLKLNFNNLPAIYERFLERRFLLNNEVLVNKTSLQERSVYEALIEGHKQNSGVRWRSTVLEDIGIVALCNSLGIDAAVSALTGGKAKASSTERSRRSRLVSRMPDVMLQRNIAGGTGMHSHSSELKACFEHLKEIIRLE